MSYGGPSNYYSTLFAHQNILTIYCLFSEEENWAWLVGWLSLCFGERGARNTEEAPLPDGSTAVITGAMPPEIATATWSADSLTGLLRFTFSVIMLALAKHPQPPGKHVTTRTKLDQMVCEKLTNPNICIYNWERTESLERADWTSKLSALTDQQRNWAFHPGD